MTITIIGTGFVGVVSAAVYASLGNTVTGLDIDPQKISSLKKGQVPFFEPELEKLLKEQQAAGTLTFTTDYQKAIAESEIVIVAVGTPSASDGQADLRYVLAAAKSMAPHLQSETIIAVKSTVPPSTFDKITKTIKPHTKHQFYLASLPEFLREGSAVHDTLHPDRVVIGATDQLAFEKLETLHAPLKAPIVKVKPSSAQMGKYTANAYLATRITFINQIADLCEKNGADIDEVIEVISHDQRIGDHYWYPGFGYGGSCFPKDVKELAAYSRSIGETDNVLNKINDINTDRITKLMSKYGDKIGGWSGKTVAVLGLSFKPRTNDMREAPSTKVIPYLVEHQATVKGYDPKALSVVDSFITANAASSYSDSIEETVRDADVIMALIEWPEIIEFDFSTVRHASKKQWFIDARNQFDSQKMTAAGYHYIGVGK